MKIEDVTAEQIVSFFKENNLKVPDWTNPDRFSGGEPSHILQGCCCLVPAFVGLANKEIFDKGLENELDSSHVGDNSDYYYEQFRLLYDEAPVDVWMAFDNALSDKRLNKTSLRNSKLYKLSVEVINNV